MMVSALDYGDDWPGFWDKVLTDLHVRHDPGVPQPMTARLGDRSPRPDFAPTWWLPDYQLWGHVLSPYLAGYAVEQVELLHAFAHLSTNGGGGCHDEGGHDVIVFGRPQTEVWRVHMHKGRVYAQPWQPDGVYPAPSCTPTGPDQLDLGSDAGEITEDARIVLAA